jgi:hypothetical protein
MAALRLSYGDSTDLLRINLGWASQRDNQPPGFSLDLERGYWARNQADEDDQDDAAGAGRVQHVEVVKLQRAFVSLHVSQGLGPGRVWERPSRIDC